MLIFALSHPRNSLILELSHGARPRVICFLLTNRHLGALFLFPVELSSWHDPDGWIPVSGQIHFLSGWPDRMEMVLNYKRYKRRIGVVYCHQPYSAVQCGVVRCRVKVVGWRPPKPGSYERER